MAILFIYPLLFSLKVVTSSFVHSIVEMYIFQVVMLLFCC